MKLYLNFWKLVLVSNKPLLETTPWRLGKTLFHDTSRSKIGLVVERLFHFIDRIGPKSRRLDLKKLMANIIWIVCFSPVY